MLSDEVLQHITASLQTLCSIEVRLQGVQQVFGGDINQTFLLQTTAGKFFLKTNENALSGMFEKESTGLALLKSTNTLHVPTPLINGYIDQTSYLVMEWVEKGKPAKNFWQQFGYGLANLHKHTQPNFGLDEDNYIGSIPQQNAETPTWAAFYAQQRIVPLMQTALRQHKCSLVDMKNAEKLCASLMNCFPLNRPHYCMVIYGEATLCRAQQGSRLFTTLLCIMATAKWILL